MTSKTKRIFVFHWRGFTANGKKVKGEVLAFQEPEARAILNEQRVRVVKMKRRSPSSTTKRRNAATPKDITLFTRQVATMLEAGVPLNSTLQLLKSSAEKAEMRLIISEILNHIESGTSLSQAMKTTSPLFDHFYCDLVATGEQTGRLEQIFDRICLYREKDEAMRSKVIKAMIYPSIVFILAIGVSIAMLLFVIPTFKDIFSSFNAELPWFTQQILNISEFLQSHGLILLAVLIMLVFIYRHLHQKYYQVRLKLCRFLLKIPVIGDVMTKASIARFTRTLATTFTSGIPLLNGISAAGKTANNLHFEEAIAEVHKQTIGGRPLHRSIQETGVFPDMMIQMVMIGEESGSLDDMLNKVANVYETDVDNIVDNLGKIIEPVIIVVLGLLIGSLVVAMYLPMFNLMSVMG